MITSSPTASPAEAAARGRTITTIAVTTAIGNVRVQHRSSSVDGAPRIRAVVLETTESRARISLVPEGALLLSGDDVLLDLHVGPGVHLDVVEPAGTVAYDMRGGSARWRIEITVEDGGSLVWHGEPFVVAEGADVRRETYASIATGGTLALRETLVLGRHGEGTGDLRQTARYERPDGTPLLVDGFAVRRGRIGLGLGDQRVVESVLLIGGAPGAVHDRAVSGTVLELEEGGVLWRALAEHAHETDEMAVWQAAARGARP